MWTALEITPNQSNQSSMSRPRRSNRWLSMPRRNWNTRDARQHSLQGLTGISCRSRRSPSHRGKSASWSPFPQGSCRPTKDLREGRRSCSQGESPVLDTRESPPVQRPGQHTMQTDIFHLQVYELVPGGASRWRNARSEAPPDTYLPSVVTDSGSFLNIPKA